MRHPTSFKLSPDAKVRLTYLSKLFGINRTSVLEFLLRGKGAEETLSSVRTELRRSAEGQHEA